MQIKRNKMCNSSGLAGYYEEPEKKKKKKKKKKKSGISGIFDDSGNAGSVLVSIGAGMLGGALAKEGTAFVVEKVIPDSSENMKRAVKNGTNAVLGTIGAVVSPNKYAKAALAGVAIEGGVDGIVQGIEMFKESQVTKDVVVKPVKKSTGDVIDPSLEGTDDYDEERMNGTDDYDEERMNGTDDYDEEHGVNIAEILSEDDYQQEIKGVPTATVRGNLPMY